MNFNAKVTFYGVIPIAVVTIRYFRNTGRTNLADAVHVDFVPRITNHAITAKIVFCSIVVLLHLISFSIKRRPLTLPRRLIIIEVTNHYRIIRHAAGVLADSYLSKTGIDFILQIFKTFRIGCSFRSFPAGFSQRQFGNNLAVRVDKVFYRCKIRCCQRSFGLVVIFYPNFYEVPPGYFCQQVCLNSSFIGIDVTSLIITHVKIGSCIVSVIFFLQFYLNDNACCLIVFHMSHIKSILKAVSNIVTCRIPFCNCFRSCCTVEIVISCINGNAITIGRSFCKVDTIKICSAIHFAALDETGCFRNIVAGFAFTGRYVITICGKTTYIASDVLILGCIVKCPAFYYIPEFRTAYSKGIFCLSQIFQFYLSYGTFYIYFSTYRTLLGCLARRINAIGCNLDQSSGFGRRSIC